MNVTNTEIVAGYRTDHSAVKLSLNFNNHKKGRSYWKFNCSLLKDKDYIQVVKDTIKRVKRQYAAADTDDINTDEIPIQDILDGCL